MNQAHTEATRVYRTYHNVDQAFKKMIIDNFEDPFLNALSDEVIGYANCTSLQFFSPFDVLLNDRSARTHAELRAPQHAMTVTVIDLWLYSPIPVAIVQVTE
jgi:hypothetical protein